MRENDESGKEMVPLDIPIDKTADTPTKSTDKAFGITIFGKMVWFPMSQIQNLEQGADSVKMLCPMWLVQAKLVEAFIV